MSTNNPDIRLDDTKHSLRVIKEWIEFREGIRSSNRGTHADWDRFVTKEDLNATVRQSKDFTYVNTATYMVNSSDRLLVVDTTSTSITLVLPDTSTAIGQEWMFYKPIAANTMTMACQGSDTISGSATLAVTTRYTMRGLYAIPGAYVISRAHL